LHCQTTTTKGNNLAVKMPKILKEKPERKVTQKFPHKWSKQSAALQFKKAWPKAFI